MNKKILAIAVSAVIVIAGTVAFWNTRKVERGQDISKEVVVITDGRGEIQVTKNPERIVTFDYGVLDILDNIGIDVVGLPKSALPSDFSKYKDDKYKNLGDLKTPDFEAVNSAKPDLIIISGRQEDMYDKFSEIAPTILLDIDGEAYMDTFTRNVNALGKIFDKGEIVEEKLKNIEKQIEDINRKVTEKHVTASTIMVNDGALSAFGGQSRFGIIYNQLGFDNVDNNMKESTHGQQISFEYLVEKNSDYIFVVDRGAAQGKEGTAKSILDNELVKSTNAYKNNKIVYLNSVAWYTVAGGINSTETMLKDIDQAIK